MRQWTALLVLLSCCGNRSSAPAQDAGPSEACVKARTLRSAAQDFETKGHELLAKSKLDEANAACPDERASTSALESKIAATLGDPAIPSKGTDATARAKMHQAFAAEHTKDYARAKTLWLDAWSEHHPNPVALESAARAAGLAGDAVEARRLRDRALFEAESTEHATAKLTNHVRVSLGAARLVDRTLIVGQSGEVVARDLASGELRALLDVNIAGAMEVSPLGTLAMTKKWLHDGDKGEVVVYDLLAREPLLGGEKFAEALFSPDDKLVLVRARDGSARIIDVETGAERGKADGETFAKLRLIGFDSKGRLLVKPQENDPSPAVLEDWDLAKNALGSLSLPAHSYIVSVSANGRYMVTLPPVTELPDGPYSDIPLEVRDLETGKSVARWTGRFITLDGFDVTGDASVVATKSRNSVRLWTVADHKQTFKLERTRRGDNFDSDLGASVFSDDGKTVVVNHENATTLWDVATGKETPAISDQRHKNVLGVTPLPGGALVVVLEDEVHVVPREGDMRVLCKGYEQIYYPNVGPTSVAVSPSGKALACAMNMGGIHVFDTTTWEERSHMDGPAPGKVTQTMARYEWDGVPPSVRPADLAFSRDDATLTVVTDEVMASYDAATGKQLSKLALRDPKLVLARRHVRLSDGRVLIKTKAGAGALFDASGKRAGDVTLVADAPLASPDAFSTDGKTYAVAVGKVLHRVDVDTGADRTTDLPDTATWVALSTDGKSCAVVLHDGSVQRIDDVMKKLEVPLPARRALFVGQTLVVVAGDGDTLLVYAGDSPKELEVDPNGVIARSSRGTFEVRGRPEGGCKVGRFDLTQETCADRAESGLVDAWIASLK